MTYSQAAPATWPYTHASVADVERRQHGRRPRAVPDDFASYARTHNVAETRAHYGIAYHTFRKWADEAGLTDFIRARSCELAATRVPQKPVPDDFADHAPYETSAKLRVRYATSSSAIARWRKEAGIPAPSFVRDQEPVAREPRPRAPRRQAVGHWHGPIAIAVDHSTAAQAQRFLQRFGPCFKASTLDKARTGYVVDGREMSEVEMMALAEKRGWERF